MSVIYLCAQHKGGVGKTTLAVHAAAVFRDTYRTLLVDCDSQADAYTFYARSRPSRPLESRHFLGGLFRIVWNPNRERLRRLINADEYDKIVMDMESPARDTVKLITENDPNVILIPADDQLLGIKHIHDTLDIAIELEGRMSFPLDVRIVPLGIPPGNVEAVLKGAARLPKQWRITPPVKRLRKEMNSALSEGQLIWDHLADPRLHTIFSEIVS